MAESKRQLKYNRLIQKELGNMFQKEFRSIFGKAFVTVTVVRTTPDLGMCKVYVSVLLATPDEVIKILTDNHKQIKRVLGNNIRNQVRVVPELSYFIDDTGVEADRIHAVISKLNIPKEDKED